MAFLCVHEFGHIGAAWLSGGRVGEVVLFSLRPHVQILGFASDRQEAFRAAGGSLCSLLACLGLLLSVPRAGFAWKLMRDTVATFGCIELLGWTLSSLMPTLHSTSPDDAERFLAVSRFNPHVVAAICAVVALIGVLIFRRSGVCRNRPAAALPMRAPRSKAAAAGS